MSSQDKASFDLTPDPRVLIVLTRTPLQPLDALCELIDNSIDGFDAARRQGVQIEHPLIAVDLPTRAELRDEIGRVLVRDNGPGMTDNEAEQAIRAGYSNNNPYDSLGLFGMGFNIATGKLGRRTTVTTLRLGAAAATRVAIDLEAMRHARSFRVPYESVASSEALSSGATHGTQVDISGWWPGGDANSSFVNKLVQYGLPTIRKELGRRYATILRRNRIRILVNGEECIPFEHCAWSDTRFVERRGHGHIPARFNFDEVVGHQRRCASCRSFAAPDKDECPGCQGTEIRTVEESVRGWVGIQRYDDSTDFGVDLIRNGRCIRIAEKDAFFTFVNELKHIIKDYPIDQQYGRIIGEVHLDQVPVDFMKQDFQRSSPEWSRAMEYLRGASSLQPNNPGASENKSPIFRLYQGFRRVRNFGRADMYMGVWDPDERKPKRIPREKEQELRKLFAERQPGYFDDTEWWKLVEQADQAPVAELIECPSCAAQNIREADVCQICSTVLKGHPCISGNCAEIVASSARACATCGTDQSITTVLPWKCPICQKRNSPDIEECPSCNAQRDSRDPMAEETLRSQSIEDLTLSRRGFSIRLPDGAASPPIDVAVYRTDLQMQPHGSSEGTATVILSELSRLSIFLHTAHHLFALHRTPVETMVAAEIAAHIAVVSSGQQTARAKQLYSLSNLTALVLDTLIGTPISAQESFAQDLDDLTTTLRERLQAVFEDSYQELYEAMGQDEVREMLEAILRDARDPADLPGMVKTGIFLEHVSPRTFQRIVTEFPTLVFDGQVWKPPYTSLHAHAVEIAEQQQRILRQRFNEMIGEVYEFGRTPDRDTHIRERAVASLRYLRSQLA